MKNSSLITHIHHFLHLINHILVMKFTSQFNTLSGVRYCEYKLCVMFSWVISLTVATCHCYWSRAQWQDCELCSQKGIYIQHQWNIYTYRATVFWGFQERVGGNTRQAFLCRVQNKIHTPSNPTPWPTLILVRSRAIYTGRWKPRSEEALGNTGKYKREPGYTNRSKHNNPVRNTPPTWP